MPLVPSMHMLGTDLPTRLRTFKTSAPLMYDMLVDRPMSWAHPTVEWLPCAGSSEGRQLLLLGTQTGGQDPNMLKVTEVQLSNPFDAEADREEGQQQQGMDVDGGMEEQPSTLSSQHSLPSQPVQRLQTFCFQHPPRADIDRARHMPQIPHLVATKSSDQGLYLFDISPALGGASHPQHSNSAATHVGMQQQQRGGGAQGPATEDGRWIGMTLLDEDSDSVEYLCGGPLGSLGPQRAAQQNQAGSSRRKAGSSNSFTPAPSGYGLCWSPSQTGWLLSTCARGVIAHIRLDTSSSLPTAAGTEFLPSALPVLATVKYQRDAHVGGVHDVAFPALQKGAPDSASSLSASNYLSVGEDGRLKLWDERSPGACICVHAHSGPANSVACSSNHIIATGGEDGMVRLFDLRAMGAALAALPQTSNQASSSNGSNSSHTEEGAHMPVGTTSCGNGYGFGPPPPQQQQQQQQQQQTHHQQQEQSPQGPYQGFPPLRVFGSHHCAVNQVSWSPDWPQLLASVDCDNRMFLWDVSRTQASPSDFTSPPQLRFIHGGQVGPIYDISWSTTPSVDQQPRAPVLASVSFAAYTGNPAGERCEETESTGGEEAEGEEKVLQNHTLQVFTPDAEILQIGV